jgi:hypothetical protein
MLRPVAAYVHTGFLTRRRAGEPLPFCSVNTPQKENSALDSLTICLLQPPKSVHRTPRNTPSEIHSSKDEGSDNSQPYHSILFND